MKLTSILSAALLVAGTLARKELTPDKIERDIKEPKLKGVLRDLNKIARKNGGNRAFGMPGYKASLDYVLDHVQHRYRKDFDTYVQSFTHLFAATHSISLTGPDGKGVDVITLQYNNPTPLPNGVTAPLVALPIDDVNGSGCTEEQWQGIDVDGKIALIKRGVCPIADKLRLAKEKGALGAVLIHNVPGPSISSATLSAENYGTLAPVAVVTLEKGTEWKGLVDAGETVEVTLIVDAVAEQRESWNIIAETKEGDPNNVIMLGAHLDSVQEGPGVNDDGSGTAALLTFAESIKKYKGIKNKIRLAWWGAEESGLIGSIHYVSQLSEKEKDKIRFYFNYDMIGSPNPFYRVYADTDAHKAGGHFLFDYLTEKGYPAEYGAFGTSSDYLAFIQAGIPSSGLFTGAGGDEDPCYHTACDDLENIHWGAITVNSKAAARAAAELALDASDIPRREKTTVNPRSKRGVARDLIKWTQVAKGAEKLHSCGGGKKQTV